MNRHEKIGLIITYVHTTFWILKSHSFLCKHSRLTNFSPFMQPLIRNLIQLIDCEYLIQYGIYSQLYE